MQLEFRKLPLVEVVIRCALETYLPTSQRFLSDLKKELPDSYSEIDDLQMIEPGPGGGLPVQLNSNLGARFDDPGRGISLIVQQNVIGVRWISDRTSGQNPQYPRFKTAMLASLLELRKALTALVGEEALVIPVVNISYVNFIEGSRPLGSTQLQRYLRGVISDILMPAESLHEVNLSWRMPDQLDLRIAIRVGELQFQEPMLGYVLTTTCGANIGESETFEQAIVRVHDGVCTMFDGILTEDANEQWERVR